MAYNRLIDYEEFRSREIHCSLQEASKDTASEDFMSLCTKRVVNFDLVKKYFWNARGMTEETSKSADALCERTDDKWSLIEFKNGKFENHEISQKIKDSILMINCITNTQIDESRKFLSLAFVYNVDKRPLTTNEKKSLALAKKGTTDYTLFGLSKLKNYCFGEVCVFEKNEFDESEYVSKIKSI